MKIDWSIIVKCQMVQNKSIDKRRSMRNQDDHILISEVYVSNLVKLVTIYDKVFEDKWESWW